MIRVFLVDDHPVVLAGLEALLAGSVVAQVVGTATDGASALAGVGTSQAEVVLTDISLGDLDGIELCGRLKRAYPALKVLGLSTFNERSYITRLLEAGASGYLLKTAGREELEEGILTAWRGRLYFSPEVARVMTSATAQAHPVPTLTMREREVLALIAEGLTNIEIGERLYISPLTVDTHRKHLLAKFGVKNTAQMVRLALEYRLL